MFRVRLSPGGVSPRGIVAEKKKIPAHDTIYPRGGVHSGKNSPPRRGENREVYRT